MAENYREQNQEEAEGIVDAGGFVDDPGTGMIAENQETAAAAEAQPEAVAPAPALDDEENIEEAEASENVQVDLHEDSGSGIDWAVIVIVLLIIIGFLSFGIANMPTEEEQAQQQIIAEQQAAQSKEYEPIYEIAELPEGVAAVVNGEYIEESTIDEYVASFRKLYKLEDDGDWSAWLIESDYTPEKVRETGITTYISNAIVRQAVEEFDVVVPESAVDEIYQSHRVLFETEEEWQDGLEQASHTEESFRQQCWDEAANNALMDYLGAHAFATPEEEDAAVLEAVNLYYPEYAQVASLAEVPADEVGPVREMVVYYAGQEAFSKYVDDLLAKGAIKMSAPPAELPYGSNSLEGIFKAIADQVAAQQGE